eukprot:16248654-Heterocapsa_arctica.AAC.1
MSRSCGTVRRAPTRPVRGVARSCGWRTRARSNALGRRAPRCDRGRLWCRSLRLPAARGGGG